MFAINVANWRKMPVFIGKVNESRLALHLFAPTLILTYMYFTNILFLNSYVGR